LGSDGTPAGMLAADYEGPTAIAAPTTVAGPTAIAAPTAVDWSPS